MLKKVISCFLALSLFASALSIPAYASDDNDGDKDYVSKDTFWNWIDSSSEILQKIDGYGVFGSGFVCPNSEDTLHHASKYVKNKQNGYFDCVCEYCGKTFTAYETDLKQSYTDQVSTLPGSVYTSSGTFLYSPSCSNLSFSWSTNIGYTVVCEHFDGAHSNSNFNSEFICEENKIRAFPYGGNLSISVKFSAVFDFEAPVDGYYKRLGKLEYSGIYSKSNSEFVPFSYTPNQQNGIGTYYVAGKSFTVSSSYTIAYLSGIVIQFYPPVYEVTPISSIDTSIDSTYNITTRPTSISGGNYGIVGDNGQITTVSNNSTIVNETNNTYYNPATGETSTISNWSYNYEDRSYTVTTDSGNTSTVTYGDEYITITENNVVEGDTIVNNYTIYYVIEGSGSGTGTTTPDPVVPDKPDPSTCKHEYTLSKTAAPDCKNAGYKIYNCTLCGYTYTESLAALGHDWHVVDEATETPDSSGSDAQASAYTFYRCSRCGIEYKDTDGSGAPSDAEDSGVLGWLKKLFGSILGGILDVLGSLVGGMIDLIVKLVDDLVAGVTHVIDSLFAAFSKLADFGDGFRDFLAEFFYFLPEEITILLSFSVSLGIILMLIKFLRG